MILRHEVLKDRKRGRVSWRAQQIETELGLNRKVADDMVPHILVLQADSLPALKQLQPISSDTFSCINNS